VQVIDPQKFAGHAAFVRQMAWTVAACRQSPPRPGFDAVRLPGQSAMVRRRAALADGVRLHPAIMPALQGWAQKLAVTAPTPIG
jgi:L-lactate dehydrogenase